MKKIFNFLKTRPVFYFAFLLLASHMSAFSQSYDNTVFLVKPHDKSNSLMINRQGKIVKEFESHAQIRIVDNGKASTLSMLYGSNYASHDFNNGALAVNINNEWSLYDITGKRLTTIDKKYSYLGSATGGLFLATKINESNTKAFTSVFLDAAGAEVFGGKKIWNASAFNGNHAFAREEDDSGAWIILNKKLMTFSSLPAPLSERIESVTKIVEPYFVVYQNRNQGWGEILTDSLGNIVFDPESITGIKSLNFVALKGSICVFGKNNQFYIVRDFKTLMSTSINLRSVDGISDQYIFINKMYSKDNLYDHNLQAVTLPLKANQVFRVIKLNDQFLSGFVWDSLTQKREYRVYDAKTLQLLGSSDKIFEDIIADVWVGIEGNNSFNKNLSELYNFNNSQLFKLPTSYHMFRGIASTKGYSPTEIHHLEVMDNEDLSQLKQFKNLRSLQFFDFKFISLPPVIKKLKSLEALDLTLCRSITALPTWLPELSSLKFIDIIDCKNLRNIEPVLLKLPKLKVVTTMNYDFDDQFIQTMQQPGARFQVNNIYGTSLDEGPVLEEPDR